MKSLGVLVDNLSMNQCNYYLINSLNKLCQERNISCSLFYSQWTPTPFSMLFSKFQEVECWDFNEPVITTIIDGVYKLANCPGPKEKYFYVWDLDWTMMTNIDYATLSQIYQNDDIELIARSTSHANILENNFKKPKYIMENWNPDILESILNNGKSH